MARNFIQYLGQVRGHLYVTKALVARHFIQYLGQVQRSPLTGAGGSMAPRFLSGLLA